MLTGDEDNAISNSLPKEMADGIAGAKLVILSQCGHLSQVEQPEAVANALVEWLRLYIMMRLSVIASRSHLFV